MGETQDDTPCDIFPVDFKDWDLGLASETPVVAVSSRTTSSHTLTRMQDPGANLRTSTFLSLSYLVRHHTRLALRNDATPRQNAGTMVTIGGFVDYNLPIPVDRTSI